MIRAVQLLAIFWTLLLPASQLLAAPLPPRGFVGLNTAVWDPNVDTPAVTRLLSQAGVTALRFPGGSSSDHFDWTQAGGTTTAQFAHLAHRLNAVVTITTNYGSGSSQMAAAWLAYCNASAGSRVTIGVDNEGRDWKIAGYWAALRGAQPLGRDDGLNQLRAGHPAPFAFRNWEIGNECFGSWEYDRHRPAHDAALYARFVVRTAKLMRAVDPAARIGVVVTESVLPFQQQESVTLPGNKVTVSEWTPVVLSALATHSVRPDFVAFHHYAQNSGQESDKQLFGDAYSWPVIVRNLRRRLDVFYGAAASAIGIACTECNSVAFNPGPQTTGLANARYYSEVAPVAQRLGIESFFWWTLHNGANRSGYDTHSLLNRYAYGDYGILGSAGRQDQPYPVYYSIRQFATGH